MASTGTPHPRRHPIFLQTPTPGAGYRHAMPLVAILALILAVASTTAAHAEITGRASVIDGDTIEVQGQRIRLWGIDAPESGQTCERDGGPYRCGQAAANALDRYLAGRPVVCRPEDVDRYRRVVACCTVGGADLGAWLVRAGMALRHPDYARLSYVVEEIAARHARRGVWAGSFERPWHWRRTRRR